MLRLRHKLVLLQKGYILLSLLPTKYITIPNIIQLFYKKGVFWENEMCTSIYVGCMRKLKDKDETLLKLLSGIPSLYLKRVVGRDHSVHNMGVSMHPKNHR